MARKSGEKEAGTLDLRNEGLADSDTQIDAQDWFGEEDARRFIQHGDAATRSISSQAAGLEQQFYVVSPRMGDTAGSIDISDDVKAHIRSLQNRPAHRAAIPSVESHRALPRTIHCSHAERPYSIRR